MLSQIFFQQIAEILGVYLLAHRVVVHENQSPCVPEDRDHHFLRGWKSFCLQGWRITLPHTAFLTKELLGSLGWEILPHPPYSPDLIPSDFHLFPHLKEPLRGENVVFGRNERSCRIVKENSKKTFYEDGLFSLLKCWRKCIANGGDYIEKLCDDNEGF